MTPTRHIRIGAILAAAACALLPGAAGAASPLGNFCPIPALPCVFGGAQGLNNMATTVLFPSLRILFIGILILFFAMYAFRLLMEGDNPETINETKSAYAYGITGAVIVSICTYLAEGFGRSASQTIVNPMPVVGVVGNIVTYMRMMLGVAVTALIVVQGIRLILLQGEQSEMEAQKKRFFHGLLGVAVVLLADSIIAAVQPGNYSQILNVQIVGIINYILTLLGAMCILAIIVGGLFLVFSVQEGLVDRAKKSIFTAVIALIVVLCSWAIVNFVLGL